MRSSSWIGGPVGGNNLHRAALPGLRGLVHDLIAIVADLVPTEDQSETYPSGIAFVSEQQVCSEVKLRILRGE